MKSTQIRELRQQFRVDKAPENRVHARAKPACLIVNNAEDPTTMFNTAGMQPLVPYLMGKEHPTGSQRVYNIQGCVRTVDIDEVGDVSHLTFFEMMGNRSLGDYFKQEAITWSREFLTGEQWLALDPQMLCVTIFEGDEDAPLDEEARKIWQEVGVPAHRITPLDKKENRWGPAGATGPCGPDSEIFYRVGEGTPPQESHPGNDEDNWLEIWNNVFMGYYKDKQGVISEMDKKNVDTGMGFERICMVVQGQQMKREGTISALSELSVYDVDVFGGVMDILVKQGIEVVTHRRIVADHLRTALWLIEEGLVPSNEGRGYVLRRIIRRAYFVSNLRRTNTSPTVLLDPITTYFNDLYGGKFTTQTSTVIKEEMEQFHRTIAQGEKKFNEIITGMSGEVLGGDEAFKLYDTYGFPLELTQELAASAGLSVDMKGFKEAMDKAKKKSRAGGKQMFAKDIDRASYIDGLPPTEFVGYDSLMESGSTLLKDIDVEGQRVLVFDRTPFYAEGGGQKGDSGRVELDDGIIVHIRDVQKYGGVYLHFVG